MFEAIKSFGRKALALGNKLGTGIKAAIVGTVATVAATVPEVSYAADYSTLTTAVDWEDVGVALLAVGVAIIGIFVVIKGIKLVVRMVKGA